MPTKVVGPLAARFDGPPVGRGTITDPVVGESTISEESVVVTEKRPVTTVPDDDRLVTELITPHVLRDGIPEPKWPMVNEKQKEFHPIMKDRKMLKP